MSDILEGRIHSSLGGSYAVITGEGTLACRARGLFRRQGITPLVGDHARVERIAENEGYILEILPRKNALARPPLANLDQLFLLCSTTQPRPSLRLLDTLIALAELSGIEPVVVFTKCDLENGAQYAAIYRAFPCFMISPEENVEPIRAAMAGKTSAFCGNTGVGKSTLLNHIAPELILPVGEISAKLGRGRHTTRHVELYPAAGGWVADTPGFSALEPLEQEALTKENLTQGFREFEPYLSHCKFQDCAHVKDSGCAVIQAVKSGEIPPTRHESYCAIYEELKKKKDWE
ncbi:MAG: ribosome small subunit-dependent GTPase A [Oscillospiraceae bacterium]|nr:ribosome small subunit-dependent GTPase A [Oscillospiraceae bacterium]